MLIGKLEITQKEIEDAQTLLKHELICPITPESIFKAAIYSLLSSAEQYTKQKLVYDELLRNKIDTPESISENKQKLEGILSRINYPNSKSLYIYEMACNWRNLKLPYDIISDINDNRKKEFELRDRVSGEIKGFGLKCASLLMLKCGYENVAPIDRWMALCLKNVFDYEFEHNKIRGIKPKLYFQLENVFQEQAKICRITPAFLQSILWGKFSTWQNKTENKNQMKLF